MKGKSTLYETKVVSDLKTQNDWKQVREKNE